MDALEALGDPVRRALITRLALGDERASDLGEGLGVSRPAVSRHLRVLREAGLVVARVDGRERIYRLDHATIAGVRDWLGRLSPPVGASDLDALATEVARARRAPAKHEEEEIA